MLNDDDYVDDGNDAKDDHNDHDDHDDHDNHDYHDYHDYHDGVHYDNKLMTTLMNRYLDLA